jgi:bisphosphoglycerate-independent phosphoglycerate mutase (AlkP superfamily)
MVPGSGKGGIHGRPQDSDITLIFSGAGIKESNIIQNGSITDIVPTILYARGLQPPLTVTGQVLNDIFK